MANFKKRTPAQRASMRKSAWSPAARAKRKATADAKRAAKESVPASQHDALAYLLKAEAALIKQYARGGKRFTAFETLAMLALHALRGEL